MPYSTEADPDGCVPTDATRSDVPTPWSLLGLRRRLAPAVLAVGLAVSACGGSSPSRVTSTDESTTPSSASTAPPATTEPSVTTAPEMEHDDAVDAEALRPAYLGAVAFQDVASAEAAGCLMGNRSE